MIVSAETWCHCAVHDNGKILAVSLVRFKSDQIIDFKRKLYFYKNLIKIDIMAYIHAIQSFQPWHAHNLHMMCWDNHNQNLKHPYYGIELQ